MAYFTTVCNVYDVPAIPLKADPHQLVRSVRVKSLDTGRLMESSPCIPMICDDRFYIELPDFGYGEFVACMLELLSICDVETWLDLDDEVPFDDWLKGVPGNRLQKVDSETPCPQESETQESNTLESLEMSPSELRSAILAVMKQQDRAMTVREISAILNMDTIDERNRISATLNNMEDKGLVKRGGFVEGGSRGGRPASRWVVA